MSKADLLRIPGRVHYETYKKEYTDEELNQIRAEFVTRSAELYRLEEEKKEITDKFKARMKPIKDEVTRLLPICDKGYEIVSSEVTYHVDDEMGIIEFIDPETGDVIGNRKLKKKKKVPLLTNS